MSEELIKVANNVREMFAADDELSVDIRTVCDLAIAALSQQTEPVNPDSTWSMDYGGGPAPLPQSGVRDGQPRFFRGLEIVDSAAPQFSPQDTVSVPRELYQQIKLIAEEHARDVDDAGGDGCVICKHIFGAAQEGKK